VRKINLQSSAFNLNFLMSQMQKVDNEAFWSLPGDHGRFPECRELLPPSSMSQKEEQGWEVVKKKRLW
jgi:hypothetical protein